MLDYILINISKQHFPKTGSATENEKSPIPT